MIQLDANFLDDLGLGALPNDAKDEFLQHIYAELERRVGERLMEGMSDDMVNEFGNFVEPNSDGIDQWFADNLPDYTGRNDYRQLKEANPNLDELSIKSQFGAMKWLQLNRPNYPQVVGTTLDELKNEIRDNRDAILSGVNGTTE
ncbi:MAG: DUF5663 domain-containing protein [Candidatus Nanoperiomorbaceae bacterium]